MNQYKKYKGVIEKIALRDATFKSSSKNEFEPSFINYIYGNNGTGKSTIARAFDAADTLTWTTPGSEADYVIRTFTRDFVTQELKFDDNDPSMPGVITLGEDFVEAQNSMDEKQAELDKLLVLNEKDSVALETLQTKLAMLRDRYIENCWEKGKQYKQTFGGKGDFSKKELCADRVRRTSPVQHDFNDLQKRFKTATDQSARHYDQFSLLDLSNLHDIENYRLLGEAIVSTADSQFSRFMSSINATAWVKQGHDNYASDSKETCPYCQQILPTDFEKQIAECFDGQYVKDCDNLKNYQKGYLDYTTTIIESIKQAIATFKTVPQEFADLSAYEKNLALVEKVVVQNNQLIALKVATPSDAIAINSIEDYLKEINSLLSTTNSKISDNNTIVANKKREESSCMTLVWELLSFELKTVIAQYNADEKDLSEKLKAQKLLVGAQQSSLGTLRSDIAKLSVNVGGSAPTIQKVNALLKRTGFRGFSLEEHKSVPDRYVVVRDDGTPAQKLSEGERNFIAFLYFYNLVQGSWKTEDLRKGKIVVIDDPVSSMDSGVMSIVSSLVRDLIDDCFYDGQKYKIKQIFVLTHNPYFHHAVSQQMLHSAEGFYKKVAFFALKKDEQNISSISTPCRIKSKSKDTDIEYENYTPVQNSYSALWQEYKDAHLPTTLLHIINRIAEYHFFQLCSYKREDISTRVKDYVGDEPAKLAIINDILLLVCESVPTDHAVDSLMYCPSTKDIEDYKDAFRTIFKAMGQESHYIKMSGEA